jgi:hypothetical protein
MVESNKTGLVIMAESFNEASLCSQPDTNHTRRDANGHLGGTQALLQSLPLGLLALVLMITSGKILE